MGINAEQGHNCELVADKSLQSAGLFKRIMITDVAGSP
jgi:hypothetical protein